MLRKPIRLRRVIAVCVNLSPTWFLLVSEHLIPTPKLCRMVWFNFWNSFFLTLTLANAIINSNIFGQSFFAFETASAFSVLAIMMSFDKVLSTSIFYESLVTVCSIVFLWLIPATLLLFYGTRFLPSRQIALLMLSECAVASISARILIAAPFDFREGFGCLTIIMPRIMRTRDSNPLPSKKYPTGGT